jgi:glycerol-3-phosphate acyltransferase PlsY
VLAGYLCGSLPTGVLVGRLAGVDVRATGSGNIGATNVARTAGRYAGLVTLFVDVAKGALPVWLARTTGASASVVALVGLAAFLGHLFPIFSRFRGGKGVATAAGVFIVLAPAALIVSLVAFVLVVATTRIVSLASLAAVTVMPLTVVLLGTRDGVLVTATMIAGAVWIAHRDNVGRLIAGTEPRFQSKR